MGKAGERIMKIVLPKERPMSNNVFYGLHWAKQNEEAQRAHALVRYSLTRLQRVPFSEKVNIYITAYFKNRPLDSDNIAAKLYVDGLKGYIIHDDTPAYVGFVATKSEVDKENPRVEVKIVPEELEEALA